MCHLGMPHRTLDLMFKYSHKDVIIPKMAPFTTALGILFANDNQTRGRSQQWHSATEFSNSAFNAFCSIILKYPPTARTFVIAVYTIVRTQILSSVWAQLHTVDHICLPSSSYLSWFCDSVKKVANWTIRMNLL